MKELLAYTTVISNRINARKSTLVTRKNLAPETLARMVELRKQNVSLKDITSILEQEGHATSKGDAVSYALVRKHLDANGLKLPSPRLQATPPYLTFYRLPSSFHRQGPRH